MYHAGLMSFMAGGDPSRVRFLMPIGCVQPHHIDEALSIINQVATELKSEF
jgi:hypothetical protein